MKIDISRQCENMEKKNKEHIPDTTIIGTSQVAESIWNTGVRIEISSKSKTQVDLTDHTKFQVLH